MRDKKNLTKRATFIKTPPTVPVIINPTIKAEKKWGIYMSSISVTKRILTYVEKHLGRELSLEKIAKELNYSKFYIARAFKEETGVTLHQYIRGRRLNESARKLVETRQTIIEIAFAAGYGSQQAFTQAFHHEYGCTPQEYRRNGIFLARQNEIRMCESSKCRLRTVYPAGGEMAA